MGTSKHGVPFLLLCERCIYPFLLNSPTFIWKWFVPSLLWSNVCIRDQECTISIIFPNLIFINIERYPFYVFFSPLFYGLILFPICFPSRLKVNANDFKQRIFIPISLRQFDSVHIDSEYFDISIWIHLLLRFNILCNRSGRGGKRFQYILCYGSTQGS